MYTKSFDENTPRREREAVANVLLSHKNPNNNKASKYLSIHKPNIN
jgi:hypothetical protein